jgi:hypothetical protein
VQLFIKIKIQRQKARGKEHYLKKMFLPRETVIPDFVNSSITSTALFNSGARVTILTFSIDPYTS